MIYNVKPVVNPHPIEVRVPGSKSITNRALLIAALSNGRSTLKGVLFSDDSRHFIQALIDLGFPVEVDEENAIVSITGFGGKVPKKEASIDVGSAGTAARFLTAFLGLSEGKYTIYSSEQMKKRPMKELLTALGELGAKITYLEEEYHFPFIIGNSGCSKNRIEIDVDKSSQFLSALLISSVLFKDDFHIDVVGEHGMAYVEMTIKMMEQFGISVSLSSVVEEGHTAGYTVTGGATYDSRDYHIEPDLSAACYFYAMGAVLKVPAKVFGVYRKSLQGDIQFISLLEDMGCRVKEEADGIVVFPSEKALKGGCWNLSSFSDQALTLAVIAPLCDSKVVIEGIGHIRYQECDRMNAIITNLKTLGIKAEMTDTSITIEPGVFHAADIETYEDHRVAMSFTIPGLLTEGVNIVDPMCCRKTCENYFEVLEEAVLK